MNIEKPGDPWVAELVALDQRIADLKSYRTALTNSILARNQAISQIQSYLLRVQRGLDEGA